MSESIPGHIQIGGRVTQQQASEIIRLALEQNCGYDWGCSYSTPEDIQADMEANDGEPFELFDDSADMGVFGDLETYLQQQGIPFDRYSSAKYEYDADYAYFRPGSALDIFTTDQRGEIMIGHEVVKTAVAELEQPTPDLAAALTRLRYAAGLDLVPLPPFELVTGLSALPKTRRVDIMPP